MFQQLSGHERNIIGRGQVCSIVVQTRAVDKSRVGHAKRRRFLIHHYDKGFLAARNIFGNGGRCIIAGRYGNGFEKIGTVICSPSFR